MWVPALTGDEMIFRLLAWLNKNAQLLLKTESCSPDSENWYSAAPQPIIIQASSRLQPASPKRSTGDPLLLVVIRPPCDAFDSSDATEQEQRGAGLDGNGAMQSINPSIHPTALSRARSGYSARSPCRCRHRQHRHRHGRRMSPRHAHMPRCSCSSVSRGRLVLLCTEVGQQGQQPSARHETDLPLLGTNIFLSASQTGKSTPHGLGQLVSLWITISTGVLPPNQ